MRIQNARDLGLRIRDQRRARGWSQAELARRIGVSRHWVIFLEQGKPSISLELVLQAMTALGLVCDVRDESAGESPASDAGMVTGADLAAILDRGRAADNRTPVLPRKARRGTGKRIRSEGKP